ncbi:MAG: MarR family transcriptional regulator [Alphaproteobacteria bacterium]|nr:MarR family transcriptional regulator [Alphaproteobacteria bacterium]
MSADRSRPIEAAKPGTGEAADEIADRIHMLRHLYRAEHHRALRDGPHDLAQMEGKVLSFVGRNPGTTQSALVALTARDKGQVARLIGALRDRGLLEARVDEADRRSQLLYLTAEGRGIQARVQRQRLRVARLAVEGLDEDERRLLVALLRRVQSNLEAPG